MIIMIQSMLLAPATKLKPGLLSHPEETEANLQDLERFRLLPNLRQRDYVQKLGLEAFGEDFSCRVMQESGSRSIGVGVFGLRSIELVFEGVFDRAGDEEHWIGLSLSLRLI